MAQEALAGCCPQPGAPGCPPCPPCPPPCTPGGVGAHLAQQGHRLLGPGGHVLDTHGAEQLHQRLHGAARVDVIRPLGRGGGAAAGASPVTRGHPTPPPTPSQGSPGTSPGGQACTSAREATREAAAGWEGSTASLPLPQQRAWPQGTSCRGGGHLRVPCLRGPHEGMGRAAGGLTSLWPPGLRDWPSCGHCGEGRATHHLATSREARGRGAALRDGPLPTQPPPACCLTNGEHGHP